MSKDLKGSPEVAVQLQCSSGEHMYELVTEGNYRCPWVDTQPVHMHRPESENPNLAHPF